MFANGQHIRHNNWHCWRWLDVACYKQSCKASLLSHQEKAQIKTRALDLAYGFNIIDPTGPPKRKRHHKKKQKTKHRKRPQRQNDFWGGGPEPRRESRRQSSQQGYSIFDLGMKALSKRKSKPNTNGTPRKSVASMATNKVKEKYKSYKSSQDRYAFVSTKEGRTQTVVKRGKHSALLARASARLRGEDTSGVFRIGQ